MKLICLDEHQVTRDGLLHKFEETSIYGDTYEVGDDFGADLLKVRDLRGKPKFQQVVEVEPEG